MKEKAQGRFSLNLLLFSVLLVVVLGVLFHQSFVPDLVHFGNDDPLAQEQSAWAHLPGAFIGEWSDLNSLGVSGGVAIPDLTSLVRMLIGEVGFAKFVIPISLWFLGFSAFFFFARSGLGTMAAALGALAATLTTGFFSNACWGSVAPILGFAFTFLALGAVAKKDSNIPFWVAPALAGIAIGFNVMEGADIGALFSLVTAGYIIYRGLIGDLDPLTDRRRTVGLVCLNVTFLLMFVFGIYLRIGALILGALLVGTAVLNWAFLSKQLWPSRIANGVLYTWFVAAFAAFLSFSTVLSLASAVGGIKTQEDPQAKAAKWDFATQWSLPKSETLSLIVPNLFGCRINTPGSATYWGSIGRDPMWDRYFASGATGPQPPDGAFIRYTGRGIYLGTLVALVAFWAALQSFRAKNSVFNVTERRLIWFWAAAFFICLLLAWGRHAAAFYAIVYHLPWFDNFRNPDKFLHVLTFAAVVLFGYGVYGLNKRYLQEPNASAPSDGKDRHGTGVTAKPTQGTLPKPKSWSSRVSGFDKCWVVGCALAVVLSLIGWAVYANSRVGLEQYLQGVGFGGDFGHQIASFSISQVGWFVGFLAAGSALLLAIISGWLSGSRALWAAVLMGVLLSADLIRADKPYISFWNYKQKYETDAQEPIIKFLMDHSAGKPYDRVGYALPYPLATPPQFGEFQTLWGIEWTQQLFPYYNILTPDIVQMPRMPPDLIAFRNAMMMRFNADDKGNAMLDDKTLYRNGRQWQLAATRYLVGPAPLLDALNQVFDTSPNRFRIVQRFYLGPRPGVTSAGQFSDIAAIPTDDTNAPYALFEFTGALARATLFTNWQVKTNDQAALEEMASRAFDPAKTVLLPTPLPIPTNPSTTNVNSGSVQITDYKPADIKLEATPTAASVLMLADRYDPDWHVWVDGKESQVLRCDYLMRGVYLTPGKHVVEFCFRPSVGPLYEYLLAVLVGLGLLLYAWVKPQRHPERDESESGSEPKKSPNQVAV